MEPGLARVHRVRPVACEASATLCAARVHTLHARGPAVQVRSCALNGKETDSRVLQRLQQLSGGTDYEFVEAIMFDQHNAVLVTGNFTDNAAGRLPVNELGRWNAPWFYKLAEAELAHGVRDGAPTRVEVSPLSSYYHRHTAALFWEMEAILPFGNAWLFRHLLGWMQPLSLTLLKLTNTEGLQSFYEESHTAQDYLLPMSKLGEAIDVIHTDFEIYPLWICPHLLHRTQPQGTLRWPAQARAEDASTMYVDVGVYGIAGKAKRGGKWWAPTAVERFEKWLIANQGYSALYAVVQLDQESFERMFCRRLYDAVKVSLNDDDDDDC